MIAIRTGWLSCWGVVAIVFVDQLSKWLVQQKFLLGGSIGVLPGLFELQYVQNRGAAWGMLSGFQGLLVLISLGVSLYFIRYWRREPSPTKWIEFARVLLLAGILGNFIDRVRLGYVVDFLHFFFKGHHFPNFNVADAAISVGITLLLVLSWLHEHKKLSATTTNEG